MLIPTLNHPPSPKKQQKTVSKILATMVVPYEKNPTKPTNQKKTPKNKQKPQPKHALEVFFSDYVSHV